VNPGERRIVDLRKIDTADLGAERGLHRYDFESRRFARGLLHCGCHCSTPDVSEAADYGST
jgi:hypothetical protein